MSIILSPSIIILNAISVIPIMPMTAPIINSSIITSITPIVNKSTDNTLTSPLIRNPKNNNNANEAMIPMILIRFEYNWYRKPRKIIHVLLAKRKVELSNAQHDQPNYFH